jgi:hypothetical protein
MPKTTRCNLEPCVLHIHLRSVAVHKTGMEDDDESRVLIEEDYYTFFNIPRNVSY